jgi:membrane-bound lytic murein transglycosylase B
VDRRTVIVLAGVAAAVLGLAGVVMAAVTDEEHPKAPRAQATPTPAPQVPLPAPDAALPRDPPTLASALAATTTALGAAIDRWRAEGDPAADAPPRDVALLALHQQRIYRLLGDRRRLARGVITRVPAPLRAEVRDNVAARRALGKITSVRRGPPPKIRIGPAAPADVLRRHYRAAHRRFRVGPALLAAVSFVESAFGRLRNRSVSGARGPMQFMPATWRAYGMGGDVHDPRDAILGAANYLRASGAPADERGALYHYNPSPHYVEAISRYARRIRADVRAFYAYYSWQVYVGGRRLTEPPA